MENLWTRKIEENLKCVEEKICMAAEKSGRSRQDITLMAVTKNRPVEHINFVNGLGVNSFGENRAQELAEKYDRYYFNNSNIHFIGHLQSNKVRQVIDKVDCIQSLDSLSLAKEINKRAMEFGKKIDAMVEINIGKEESKSGIFLEEIDEFLGGIVNFPNINIVGLMTIPPKVEKVYESRQYFTQIHKKFIDIKGKKIDNIDIQLLSMGTSHDFSVAIEEGSTMIRVGTGIFSL